jgi:hypothetical protein
MDEKGKNTIIIIALLEQESLRGRYTDKDWAIMRVDFDVTKWLE